MTPEKVTAAFALQSRACAALGSGFMGQLMGLFADRRWPDCAITDRVFAWPGDIGPGSASVPLRLAGALHALRLNGQADLVTVYPPKTYSDDTVWAAVSQVLQSETAFIDAWMDSPPQTNEVRRSAVLIAVGHWLADRFGIPMRNSELGASGGLNLHWDQYALQIAGGRFGATDPALVLTPDWDGVLPPNARPEIVGRGGVDLNPLDPSDPQDALRLRLYLWPDQPQRMALTQAAITAAATRVDPGDAIDWLTGRLAHRPGELHLIYSTIAWQYFPAEKQAEGTRLIEAAGQMASAEAPLVWFGMENDGGERGAALTVRMWPGDLTLALGRADFHGRWIEWRAP